MATSPRYQNFQIHATQPQTDANQLDGLQGKGLFKFPLAQEAAAVVGTIDSGTTTWTLILSLPDPATPGAMKDYILDVATGVKDYYNPLKMDMPEGSQLKLTTAVATGLNPTAQVITKLLEERYK